MPTIAQIRAKFPMYSDVPDAQLLAGLHKTYYSDLSTGDFLKNIDFTPDHAAVAKKTADSLSEDGGTLKVWNPFGSDFDTGIGLSGGSVRDLANVGAGMANLGQGVRQLAAKAGIGTGPTDDEIRDKRTRDEGLAGEGWKGKGLQIAGEVAPTLVLPAGAMARPLQVLGKTSSVLAGGAAANAAGAALQPVTSDESRGANMAMAAGIGAVLPGAGQLGGKVLKQTARALTNSGANRRAIEALAEYIPTQSRGAITQALEDYRPPAMGTARSAPEIPVSAAQATGDARLAQAEAMSRAKPSTAPGWQDFDAARNASLYQTVEDLAPSPWRMSLMEAKRARRTAPLREQALEEAAQRGGFADPVLQHAEALALGPKGGGANAGVTSIANYIRNTLGADAVGEVTPARLYEVRKTLAEKLKGPAGVNDELGAAVKSAQQETRDMIGVIDDAMAGGQKAGSTWGDYLSEYAGRSAPITSGNTLRQTLGALAEKPLKGTTPEVTYQGLKTAVGKFRNSAKYGDRLTPDAGQDVGNLLDHLRSAEAAGRSRKLAGTMGGGSQTNLDTALSGFGEKVLKGLPMVGGYVSRLDDVGRGAVETEMARLLQNPGAFGEALRAMPPSRREQAIIDLLRGGNAALGGAAGAELTP